MDVDTMLHERCVHIVDDEAKVRDALTLLLSTAQIEFEILWLGGRIPDLNSPEGSRLHSPR